MRHLAVVRRAAAVLFVGALSFPSTGAAQRTGTPADISPGAMQSPQPIGEPSVVSSATTVPAAPLGTQPRGVALTRQHAVADSTTPPPAPADTEHGNTVLMLAGAATIVVGAIVGGDGGTILVIGGAVLGMFGLFRYLTH